MTIPFPLDRNSERILLSPNVHLVLLGLPAKLIDMIKAFAEFYRRRIAKVYLNLAQQYDPDLEEAPVLRFLVKRDESLSLRVSIGVDDWRAFVGSTVLFPEHPKRTARRIWTLLFLLLSEIPPSSW